MKLLRRLLRPRPEAEGADGHAAQAGSAPPGGHAATAHDERPQAERVLQRLEWTVLRRLDGLLQGDYRTLLRGNGLDLAELREYQHHDDVRRIDWNVTARLQVPHVREFHEDREVSAWFLLDRSASVRFGSGERDKLGLGDEFVAALARVLTRRGNRVGAVLFGHEVDFVLPARGGRKHVLQLLARLARHDADDARGTTELAGLIAAGERLLRRRSTVFVVSDFISAPGWEAALGRLARRHDVVAVRLSDPLERALPDMGLVTLRDAETGEALLLDTHDPAFRARFEALARQREEELMAAFANAGVDAMELAADDDLVEALLRFVELRRHRSRMAAGAVASRSRGASAPVPLQVSTHASPGTPKPSGAGA